MPKKTREPMPKKTNAQLRMEVAAILANSDDAICSCPEDDGKRPRRSRATISTSATVPRSPLQPQVSAHGRASSAEILAAVKKAVREMPRSGRFGPDKVFISEVWRVVSRDPRIGAYTIEQFKNWLVAAQRDGVLQLARADLVGAMDPRLVRESEIQSLGSTFHFVIDPDGHY